MAFIKGVIRTGDFEGALTSFRIYNDGAPKEVKLDPWIATSVKTLFEFGFPLVFWLATYYRLKEKEI